jgi:hypothetical protein
MGIWLFFIYPLWGKPGIADHPIGEVLPEDGAT